MRDALGDPAAFHLFRDFMLPEALRNSPELGQIDQALEAQLRVLDAADRAFWAPTIGLKGDLDYMATAGEGTEFDLGMELPPGMESDTVEADDINGTLTLFLTLPLYTGGRRVAESDRADAELEQIILQRSAIEEQLEQGIRSALHRAGAFDMLASDAEVAAFFLRLDAFFQEAGRAPMELR